MRGSTRVPYLTVVLLALALQACGDEQPSSDTCTSGKNMTDPRLVNGLEPSAGGSFIRITWDPGSGSGAQLPSDYFSAVQVSSETASDVQNLITSVSLTEERQLTVRFRNLGPYLSTRDDLEFVLSFPDRQDFSSCTHSGMKDQYLLRVRLVFDAQGQLQRTEFTEDVVLGDI